MTTLLVGNEVAIATQPTSPHADHTLGQRRSDGRRVHAEAFATA